MSASLPSPRSSVDFTRLPRAALAVGVLTVAALIVMAWTLPRAGLILVTDGIYPAAILLSGLGYGLFPACWFVPETDRRGQRIALALALGLGILSTTSLMFGCLGILSFVTAWGITGGGILLFAWSLLRPRATLEPDQPEQSQPQSIATLLPAIAGLCALGAAFGFSLAGATLPPGMLWMEEAGGYDALEYHLEAPREFFDAGRIHFLPHNVYASFPQTAEMLFLLQMHLAGDALAGAIPSQLLHAMIGIAAIGCISAFAPRGFPRMIAMLTAGSILWIVYLGCLAYVENFLLFFGAVAGGLIFDDLRRTGTIAIRSAVAAGICAGLAAGCKYTAIAFVVIAAASAFFITMRGRPTQRLKVAAVFCGCAFAVFSPWLVRNVLFTGNPLFPFAYEQLGGKAWSDEQSAQWARGHRLSAADQQLGRTRVALRELIGPTASPLVLFADSRFGVVAFVLASIGAALSITRSESRFLVLWCGAVLLVWMFFTHMPGRFVMLLSAPLAWMAGANGVAESARVRCALLAVAALGTVIAAGRLGSELNSHLHRFETRTGVSAALMPGQTAAMRDAHPLASLPKGARIWVIGDAAMFYAPPQCHYTVVFNRDPWLARCADSNPADCVDFLRREGVTHVYISWSEVNRLRGTYGFSDVVTPEWAARLTDGGLKLIAEQKSPTGAAVTQLFQVSR